MASTIFDQPSPRDGFLEYLASFIRHPKLVTFVHLLGLTERASFSNIRSVLDSTLRTDRASVAPRLFKEIFKTGLKRLIINDNLEQHKYAFEILIDLSADKSQVQEIDISGPTAQAVYLAIAAVSGLRKLAIEPYRLYGDPAIEVMLYSLRLEELDIRCSERPCIFLSSKSEPVAWQRFQNVLAWHTRTLSTLKIFCRCTENKANIAKEMATIINHIPNLKFLQVGASTQVSELILDKLVRDRKNQLLIEFYLSGDREHTTRSAPRQSWNHVVKVQINRAQQQDVRQLDRFKKLKQVELEIMDGAEEELKKVPLEKVSVLHIAGSPAAEAEVGDVYYGIQKNSIFETVIQMPLLEDVSISFIRIGKQELHSILLHTGGRLKRFETSILDQEQSPSQRLLSIVESVTLCNRNIRELLLSECVIEEVAERLTWGTETYEQYLDLHRRLTMAREMLVYSAPRLDPINLFEAVDALQPNQEVVEMMRIAHNVFGNDTQ